MIRTSAITLLILAWAHAAGAQPPEPPKSPIRLLPNYIAADQPKYAPRRNEPPPGPVPRPLEAPSAAVPSWEHLMIAADHLEAAGLNHEADELRARAQRRKSEERLSSDELRREINRLRAELEGLQKQVAGTEQIEIRLKMIEFVEERLHETGAELPALLAAASAAGGVVRNPHELLREIDRLRAKGLIKVLAEPALITMDGRPAQVLIGGELPLPIASSAPDQKTEWREFGVRVEAVAHILHGRRLRLEVQPTISELDFSPPHAPAGTRVPAITTKRVNIAIETGAGDTVVIGGMRSQRKDASTRSPDEKEQTQTTQFFVLVTADIIDRAGSPENPAPPPIRD